MRLAVALAAATALLAPIPAAHAAGGPPSGRSCTIDTFAPNAEPTVWTGVLYGGPIVAPGEAVSLRCSIHLNNGTHDGPAVAAASTAPSPSAAAIAQAVTYQSGPFDYQAVCTEATVGATTWYLTFGGWTTDAGSWCAGGDIVEGLPEPVATIVDEVICLIDIERVCDGIDRIIDVVSGPFEEYVDPVLCPILASYAPGIPGVVDIDPTGDTTLVAYGFFWDCPPYVP